MSNPNSLDTALGLALFYNWYTVPVLPMDKAAAIGDFYARATLDPDEITDLFESAQRGAALNCGILLGHSRLAVVDADTAPQVQAWLDLCAKHGYEPGLPNVRTPGVKTSSGEWKHKDGGHYFFTVPSDISDADLRVKGHKLPIGVGEEHADLMTGRRYVVAAGSRRPEGAYVATDGAPIPELPEFLADVLREAIKPKRFSGSASPYHVSEREWQWFEETDWLDALPDGWTATATEHSGCVVYGRPGGSTGRSATAHVRGCGHVPDGDMTPPMTFHTSELPDWIRKALDGRTSISKLRLYAAKHHNGDTSAVRRMLGISGRSAGFSPYEVARRCDTAPYRPRITRGWKPAKANNSSAALDIVTKRSHEDRSGGGASAESSSSVAVKVAPPKTDTPAPTVEVAPKVEVAPAPAPAPKVVEEPKTAAPAPKVDAAWSPTVTPKTLWQHILHNHAAFRSDAQIATFQAEEAKALRWAGRDDQPHAWTTAERAVRSARTDLLQSHTVTTAQLAEELGTTAPAVRMMLRAMIPSAQRFYGALIRERMTTDDPFRYGARPETADKSAWVIVVPAQHQPTTSDHTGKVDNR